MPAQSRDIPGLRATLDKLVYFHDIEKFRVDAPHAFIYFITITNLSDTLVTLKGRRWILRETSGHSHVVEGDGIAGKEPTLATGQSFSFNSYHMTHGNCIAEGSFHGIDSAGNPIHLRIPQIVMEVPPQNDTPATE